MALPDLTGLDIEDTYQRVLHTDGINVYDGTGSLFILPSANTSSLLITASATSNQITFTKGDASQFTITVDTGSSSAFTGTDQEILFISGSTATGSNSLLFDYNASTLNVNGDLYVSSSTGTIVDTSATSLGFGGVTSVDWGGKNLYDNAGTPSIDWNVRQQYDSNGVAVVQWGNGQLLDQSAILSNDWFLRYLYDNVGSLSVDWGNRNLWDANGVIVLDWLSLQLLDSGGGTAVDWGSRRTADSAGTVSMNWDSRQLFDNNSITSVNWAGRRLFSVNSATLNWRDGLMWDLSTSSSINWDSRQLFGPNNQVTLDWANNNIARVTGSLVVTGSLNVTGSAFIRNLSNTPQTNVVTIDATTGQLFLTASSALGSVASFPFTGSAIISGSLSVTGSVTGDVQALIIASSTASMDLSLGNFFTLTLESGSNTHLSPTNITPGQTINLRITQPATSGSLSYDSIIKFPGGIPYSASATGSVVDILSMISFDSSTLYATAIKNLS